MSKDGKNIEFLPPPESEGDGLDWVARMTVLHDEYGFVPTTNNERNVAFGLIPFINEPGGVGRHLNEVLRHQGKHDVAKPDSAIRALIHSMGKYRSDATSRRASLLEMHAEMRDVNPRLDIRLLDPLPVLGLLSVVQYHDILSGIKSHSDEPLRGGVKKQGKVTRLTTAYDEETHDSITAGLLLDKMPDVSVLAIRGIVLAAGRSHAKRRDFWDKIVESSMSHTVAYPLAKRILETPS